MKDQRTNPRRSVKGGVVVRLIVALAVAAAGMALWWKDRAEFQREARLRAERSAVVTQLAFITRQLDEMAARLTPERERLAQTEKVLGELRQLQSTWEWAVGNREQQRANGERIQKLESMHAATLARVAEQEQAMTRAKAERSDLESAREQLDAKLRIEEMRKLAGNYQLRRGWLWIRGWLLVGAGAGMLGWMAVAAVRRRLRPRSAGPEI